MPNTPSTNLPIHPAIRLPRRHFDALWHAVHDVGGDAAARVVDRCAALADESETLDVRLRIGIQQILDLLSDDAASLTWRDAEMVEQLAAALTSAQPVRQAA